MGLRLTILPLCAGLLGVLPAFAQPSPVQTIEGDWENVAATGAVVARVIIARSGDSWTVEPLGDCPSCTWGAQPLMLRMQYEAPVAARAGWPRGFLTDVPASTAADFSLISGRLRMSWRVIAADGQEVRASIEEFARIDPATPRPPGSRRPSLETRDRFRVPVPVFRAQPRYTGPAMRARIEGAVQVRGVVQINGTISDLTIVKALEPDGGLNEEALRAAREWRFSPGTRDGVPVPMIVTIEMEFRIRQGPAAIR